MAIPVAVQAKDDVMDTPLDDMPGYGDLTDQERWVILAYRRLKDDYKLVDTQAKEGMLDTQGATAHAILATQSFLGTVHRHLVEEMKGK